MDYRILIIDDDEPMHIITKNILGKEFDLLHARNAQQGIDILSAEPVSMVLSDIHMPGISGLEFLESLMNDAEKRQVPVLIMTNLPTVEKEKKALDLGAADFIDKTLFTANREEVLKRVRMKLVTHVTIQSLDTDLTLKKNRLVMKVMSEAIKNDFTATVACLCRELQHEFETDYTACLISSNGHGNSTLVYSDGRVKPDQFSMEELIKKNGFSVLSETRQPYYTNHIFHEEHGIMTDFSREHNLPAEIGIPLFSLNERDLLMNNMQIPNEANIFGFIILKRNKLYSTKEFEILSRLLLQTGSILWRLHSKNN